MATEHHYYVERNDDGKYAVRAQGSVHASSLHNTQEEAIAEARRLNPNDHPNVERIRNVEAGGPDQWRKV